VDWKRYGGDKSLWMLFPDPKVDFASGREWFLVPHDKLYEWMKSKHGHTRSMEKGEWRETMISKELGGFLEDHTVGPLKTDG